VSALGARRGALREGRLSLIDTLRAAAPWQKLRRADAPAAAASAVHVRVDDFRVTRFRERRGTTAIFVVDASGSSAMQRLAEVKGAIELMLADCYVRRDSVALVAFRGRGADVVLPPTRSLARARRLLAGMPGGGGTPLALGLESASALADAVRRKGQTPLVVLLTDGKANIDRAGTPGRARAFEDALQAARRLRGAGHNVLAIDSAPVTRGGASPTRKLADAMQARYLQLPFVDPARLSQAVRAAASGS
jgi:magnesium chelatase subunit D